MSAGGLIIPRSAERIQNDPMSRIRPRKDDSRPKEGPQQRYTSTPLIRSDDESGALRFPSYRFRLQMTDTFSPVSAREKATWLITWETEEMSGEKYWWMMRMLTAGESSSLYHGRAKHKDIHPGPEEAIERFFRLVDDRLVLVERGVQDDRHAGSPPEFLY